VAGLIAMPFPLNGYHTPRRSRLLRDFEQAARRVKPLIVSGYGVPAAEELMGEARREFDSLIPAIPYLGGKQAFEVPARSRRRPDCQVSLRRELLYSEALGWGLRRTMTLADGQERCDFRFKRGGKTHVALSPEVRAALFGRLEPGVGTEGRTTKKA